ncbi:hypothetical protein [Streptococcus suis]|uniref:hypothetical protein n=1 Tax=Streptococcus suis TaxID=1307 RepID=UPI003B9DE6C1
MQLVSSYGVTDVVSAADEFDLTRMNANESFNLGGKIYITPEGIEKIRGNLRKDKEFYSVTFESKLMNQIQELRSNQRHHEWELREVVKKIDSIDKKLDTVLEALRVSNRHF